MAPGESRTELGTFTAFKIVFPTMVPLRSPSNQNWAEETPPWLRIVKMSPLSRKTRYPHVQRRLPVRFQRRAGQPSRGQMELGYV